MALNRDGNTVSPKRALILTYKTVFNTPRVLKEISWLTEEGWIVDTLGIGGTSASNGEHFSMELPKALTRYYSYLFRRRESRFEALVGERIPSSLSAKLKSYDLLIVHDLTLLPWRPLHATIGQSDGPAVWIDLHENHVDSLSRNLLEKVAFERYRKWELSLLKEVASSRTERLVFSSVSPWISERFESLLGQKVITLRNSPKLQDLPPSPTTADQVRLVHHGVGTTHRGIEQAIRALKSLPKRFSLHLMLVASPKYMLKLKLLALIYGVQDRVEFLAPVPTAQISKRINEFDIALVVNPPITISELRALPNKFFESIQASLCLVVGPNPEMSEIVKNNGNGIVLPDWETSSLTKALEAIETGVLSTAKERSYKIRSQMSVEAEKVTFKKKVAELAAR